MERLAEHIENQDPTVSLKALDTSFKIDWYQAKSDTREVTIRAVDLSQYRTDYDEKTVDVTPEEETEED